MINTRRIFCLLIITLGASLDIYFYAHRFINDGFWLPVAIAASVAMEALLAVAVYNSQAHRLWLLVVVPAIVYSVVQTSAGQTFALMSAEGNAGREIKQQANIELIAQYKERISHNKIEFESIRAAIDVDVKDQAKYYYTVKQARRRLSELSAEDEELFNKVERLYKEVSDNQHDYILNRSVYAFYSSADSWSTRQWIEFIFHTVLSIFIALMTPIGILTWGKTEKIAISDIVDFVDATWYKVRARNGDKVEPETSYNEYIHGRKQIVKPGLYSKLLHIGISTGCLNKSGDILIKNEKEVIKKLCKSL